MTEEQSNLETVERMVAAYNSAATADLSVEETAARTLQVFEEFYSPDVRWVEAPTPFFPEGRKGGRAELEAAAKGLSALLCARHYTLVDALQQLTGSLPSTYGRPHTGKTADGYGS